MFQCFAAEFCWNDSGQFNFAKSVLDFLFAITSCVFYGCHEAIKAEISDFGWIDDMVGGKINHGNGYEINQNDRNRSNFDGNTPIIVNIGQEEG